tara:strand:- start:6603 stop:7592 length:990 start_codon:yes stop_codon:yes gene_type:complete
MYSKNLEVAIIGCGYWGTNIIKTLISLKLSKIYCYDNDIKNLKKIKDRFKKVTICSDLSEILINNNIKVAFVCVPTSLIYKFAKILIKNKKNVFLEKPVSKYKHKILELIKLSKNKKVRIMTGYIYVYNRYIRYIKKNIILRNKLGIIKYIEFNRKNFGPIRNDVSSLWDLASHDLSIIKYLFSGDIKKPKHLKSEITKKKNFDIYSINFSLKKITVNINVSWLYPEKVRQILIIGSKKILMFDELNISSPVKIFDVIKKYPSARELPSKYFNPQKGISIKKPLIPKFKKFAPLRDELKFCLENILSKKKIITDGEFSYLISKNLSKFI